MTAGFSTLQPQYQPNMQYNQGYAPKYNPYGNPQPAVQTYTQTLTQNPVPAQYGPQTQQYPQYGFPQTPGIVNYVTPPNQNMQQMQNPLNSAAAQNAYPNAYQTQYNNPQYAPLGQPQALPNIPYEQNPLNMNSGFNPQGIPQNPVNNGMNAQMPAPNIQQGQQNTMNAQAPYEKQPYIDIGVVNAPENSSKTPIIDDLNRRGQMIERETPPKLRGKKTFTAGNISAACAIGSLGIILTMALVKVVKLIKHK